MTIQLYDLCGGDPSLRFSPYCWRTKMALAHKGLDVEALAWKFTEKERIAMSGQPRVPVIVDGDQIISDSWQIALYLDTAYPDRPALMGNDGARAAAQFINTWTDTTVFGPLVPFCAKAVHDILDPADTDYFRSSREQRFGKSLEEVCSADARANAKSTLARILKPVESVLGDHAFLGGESPFYGDYAVFGTLMWPHVVATEPVLEAGGAVATWFERMLDLHGGVGRSAPTVRA